MNKVNRTFSKRLSRTIMILAVPLFVLSLGVFYQYARQLLEKAAIERSHTILKTTTRLVDNYLSAIETAARSNVWMIEENFNPDSLPGITHRIVGLNKSVLSCSVAAEPNTFPQYGENYSVYSVNDGDTVRTELEPEFEYFEKNWYKKTKLLGRPCWINPFSDFNAGVINHHDAVGSYCIPLRPHGNRIEGVISVDFSFQKLKESILATNHPYPSSYYMVLGPVGGYLIHPDNSLLFKKTIFTATDSVQHPDVFALGHEMISQKHGMMHVNFDGEVRHVTYMPIKDTGWSIALVCNDEDVLADYNNLTIILIVFVLIGIILISWMTRKVVQRNIGPLNELMVATNKISEGNYDTIISPTNHKDVVGKLQNAFRKMQQALMSHQADIKLADSEIEKENAELEQTLPLAQEAYKRRQIFIQNVSRQIVSPLNIIEGLVRVLKDNIANRQKGKKALSSQGEEISHICKTLKHNAALMQHYTYMLYDSSDIGHSDLTRYQQKDDVLCNELAHECIEQTMNMFSIEPIHFHTELSESFSIKSNRLYLIRTITELLYNAAKFSDGEHISLSITQTETAVRFTIEDVGPGLPKAYEDLLFVPFTKVDDLAEGLGLGLPLCKVHMDALGGKLICDENYQLGCRIIVEMPK
jgi:signal transduction histidine kinase